SPGRSIICSASPVSPRGAPRASCWGRGQRLVIPGKPGRRGEGSRVSGRRVRVIEAGRMPYRQALDWQRELAQARIDGRREEDLLLLLEHPPVVTLGRTAQGAPGLPPEAAAVAGWERGAAGTSTGPGQRGGAPT